MSEYMPPIEQVRQLYANSMDPAGFDRMIAQVRAEAWDEGYFRRMDDYPFDPEERDNPYRKE